nr:hypothetical protein [uncultured Flavobacterium sp.]
METNNSNTCFNCEKPYPAVGYFCGGCLTQLKCKSCNFLLEKENLGCTNCGTPIDLKTSTNISQNLNTFRLHETATDRIIEATFSDTVGKDLAGILKDTYTARIGNHSNQKFIGNDSSEIFDDKISEEEFIDHKVLDSYTVPSEKVAEIHNTAPETFIPPSLLSIAIKNLPSSEMEWIIVYSYYASEFGNIIYQRKDILDRHAESKRKSDSVSRNLSANLNASIKAGYVNALNDGYYLVDGGVQKALEIIKRPTGNSPKVRGNNTSKKTSDNSDSKTPKNSGGSNKSEVKSLKRLSDINFSPKDKESLTDFYAKFQIKSDFERILIFVYYLEEILKITSITSSHIYTCYDNLELRIPENLPQTIRNAKSTKGWIDKSDSGITITFKGRNYIKDLK